MQTRSASASTHPLAAGAEQRDDELVVREVEVVALIRTVDGLAPALLLARHHVVRLGLHVQVVALLPVAPPRLLHANTRFVLLAVDEVLQVENLARRD